MFEPSFPFVPFSHFSYQDSIPFSGEFRVFLKGYASLSLQLQKANRGLSLLLSVLNCFKGVRFDCFKMICFNFQGVLTAVHTCLILPCPDMTYVIS